MTKAPERREEASSDAGGASVIPASLPPGGVGVASIVTVYLAARRSPSLVGRSTVRVRALADLANLRISPACCGMALSGRRTRMTTVSPPSTHGPLDATGVPDGDIAVAEDAAADAGDPTDPPAPDSMSCSDVAGDDVAADTRRAATSVGSVAEALPLALIAAAGSSAGTTSMLVGVVAPVPSAADADVCVMTKTLTPIEDSTLCVSGDGKSQSGDHGPDSGAPLWPNALSSEASSGMPTSEATRRVYSVAGPLMGSASAAASTASSRSLASVSTRNRACPTCKGPGNNKFRLQSMCMA
jgi:hypothetical protein